MRRTTNIEAPFQRINSFARLSGLGRGYIRQRCIEGTAPHIRVGSDYLINVPAFLEMLERESRNEEAKP